MLIYATGALFAGFLIDLILGDPPRWPHIIRWMGRLIEILERKFYSMENKRVGGILTVVLTLTISAMLPAMLLFGTYMLTPWLYFAIESLLCWQLLATKSLRVESSKVREALEKQDITEARQALSMIVGRDVESLDEAGVVRATVETVAENTSDGVVAPLFYLLFGGAPLACLYKAANTLDSMIGYRNERYLDFGRFAARLDDVLNFMPSRLCALLMIAASWICGFDVNNAYRIWQRDKLRHDSPNSAQTEAVMAGALRLRLAGDTYYFGRLHKKPYIGDDLRQIEIADIDRSHRLLYTTALLMFFLAVALRGALFAAV